ncbi:MAG: hypothetical protein HYZ65_00085 [Burkholderiales bacterium]|nr:hypothetical protein [Burkholderiales bacterium]
MPGSAGIRIELTPSRVILSDQISGDIFALARSGGSAQKIFTGSIQYRWPQLIMVGEKIWLSFLISNNLLALNSDGSNLQTFSNTQFAGCLNPASLSINTDSFCAQLMVVQNDKVRSIDAVSGALRLEYGSVSAIPAGYASKFGFSPLRTFGQTGVLSQYVYTLNDQNSASVVNYVIKTDRAGMTLLTTP